MTKEIINNNILNIQDVGSSPSKAGELKRIIYYTNGTKLEIYEGFPNEPDLHYHYDASGNLSSISTGMRLQAFFIDKDMLKYLDK